MTRLLFSLLLVQFFAGVFSSPATSKPGWPFSTSAFGHSLFGPSLFGSGPILFPKLPSFPEIKPMPVITIANTDEHGSKDASTEFGMPDVFFSVSVNKDSEVPEQATPFKDSTFGLQQPTTTTPKPQESTTRGLPPFFSHWHEWQMAKKVFATAPITMKPRPTPPTLAKTIRIPMLSSPPETLATSTATASQESKLERLLKYQADLMALLESSTLLNALNAMRLNQYINKLLSTEPDATGVAQTPTFKAADQAQFPFALLTSHMEQPSKLTTAFVKPKPEAKAISAAAADSHELSSSDFNRFIDSMAKADEMRLLG